MFNRLNVRLTVHHILLLVVVFGLLGAYLVNYVDDLQRAELRTRLESTGWATATAVQPYLLANTNGALDHLTDQLGQQTGARITIIARDGSVMSDSDIAVSTLENHAGRPEVDAALRGQVGQAHRYSTTLDRSVLYVAVPVTSGEQILGVARVAVPIAEVTALTHQIITAVLGALFLALLVTALISTLMSRVFTRPLADLVAVTRRFSHGDLEARAPTDAGGEFQELAEAFNDMARELHSTIQAIDEERIRLDAIVQHLSSGVLIVDAHGQVTLINQAAERLLRTRRNRAMGRPYAEVVRDYELVELLRDGQAAGTNDAPQSRFVEFVRPRRFIHAFAYPIPSRQAPLTILVLSDITELRRTETVRRDFVANVSHELRTPIASLKALVETLLDGALEDENAARDFLGRMEIEVEELVRLVEELLVLSRAESGQIELQFVPTDIPDVLQRAAARIQAQAEPKEIDIRLAVPDNVPVVDVDSERVEQIVVSLLHNAVKFTPPNGSITISAEPGSTALTIAVSDTGPGLPDSELERVFERFYKVDRSRSASGSGLGLAIAKHLVQLHGGQIWAESDYGKGATFKFTLPVAQATAEFPTVSPSPAANG